MVISFLRHAEATPDETDDAARALTEKGLAQADRAAKFIERIGLAPEIILSSPLVRAKQTAKPVARRFPDVELSEVQWLACGLSPETFLHEIASYQNMTSVLLVGHEPDFSTIIAHLIGLADPGSIRVKKASLTSLDLPELSAAKAQLQFSIPARLM